MKYIRFISVLFALLMLCTACSTEQEASAGTEQTETAVTDHTETTASVSVQAETTGSEEQTSPAPASEMPETTVQDKTESVTDTTKAVSTETQPPETTLPMQDTVQATFLGVSGWGQINKSGAASFTYRFDVNGQEQQYRLATGDAQNYAIQNQLKEGYHYDLTMDGDTVTAAKETETDLPDYSPPVTGTPGRQTVCNFLKLAMEPVGAALYVYGGGWNWEDTGSAIHARSIGISQDWVRFFREHNGSYNFRKIYPAGGFNEYYYAGLDCSGYVGWVVYNLFHTEDGGEGYVGKATAMAKRFADYGWGDWTQNVPVPDGTAGKAMQPGDIMSMRNHVWISLGSCSDGSIVIAHSTRSDSFAGQPGGGVQIAAVGYSVSCEAYQLANKYMTDYFPDWRARYPVSLEKPGSYLAVKNETGGRFRWNDATLTDPEGIRSMSAAEALKLIFG